MISDVLSAYPGLSRTVLGGVTEITPEMVIVVVTFAWMWFLGWMVLRAVKKPDQIDVEDWLNEKEGD